jgi:hypothetical protein
VTRTSTGYGALSGVTTPVRAGATTVIAVAVAVTIVAWVWPKKTSLDVGEKFWPEIKT